MSARTALPTPCPEGLDLPREAALVLDVGDIPAVASRHLDQLTGRPIELEEFLALADRTSASLGTVTGKIDQRTSDGCFPARMGATSQRGA
jgi:hypothetical protein